MKTLLSLNKAELHTYISKVIDILLNATSLQSYNNYFFSPIGDTANDAINEFKKMHQDDWDRIKRYLNEEQIELLSDTTTSSCYYA